MVNNVEDDDDSREGDGEDGDDEGGMMKGVMVMTVERGMGMIMIRMMKGVMVMIRMMKGDGDSSITLVNIVWYI